MFAKSQIDEAVLKVLPAQPFLIVNAKYCTTVDIYQTNIVHLLTFTKRSIKENKVGTAKFYRRSPTSKRMYDLSCCPRVISKHTKEQTEIDYKVFIMRVRF